MAKGTADVVTGVRWEGYRIIQAAPVSSRALMGGRRRVREDVMVEAHVRETERLEDVCCWL